MEIEKYLKNAYKNKRILITGHTGFKGSWLALWLNELGAKVTGYALEPYTQRDNFIVTNLKDRINDIRGDIRDFEHLKKTVFETKPDIIFHLAAQPLVVESYDNPKDTYDINVGGTVNLFEAARSFGEVKAMLNITTDKCYENKEWVWGYRENDSMGGHDPYSSSKGCSEIVTESWRRSFFNDNKTLLSSARAGNVFGGGDWQKYRIIPDCIKALENNEPIFLRNPGAIRPWQFVLEPLGGYLFLVAKMLEKGNSFCGGWNFGPQNSSIKTVEELVEKLVKAYGKGEWRSNKVSDAPHEANFLMLDISKALFNLKWHPVYNLNESVKETVAWYKNYDETEDMYAFCSCQIQNYMKKWDVNSEVYS